METVSIKKKGDFQTSLWSGGSTTQLYIYPEDGDYKQGNFQCRISSATVETERSDFTKLPGVKRYLSIFQGHLDLVHGEEQRVSLKPFQVDCFDGGVPTVSYGKVVDFNLMLKHGAKGQMETLQLKPDEGAVLAPKEGENLLVVYVADGEIAIGQDSIKTQELFICKEWTSHIDIKNKGSKEAGLGICRILIK